MPALGAIGSGLVTTLAPETRGGGGDAMIDAFHHGGGVIRRRVMWIKGIASILTLGAGGAGGREGPTMLIGGALGSAVSRWLGISERERRILLVAGVAAGIAAVFRTPLGAALFAAEVLYRDDFESDALIPAVLASVIAYSVVISLFGVVDAVRARDALSVRHRAPAALWRARRARLDRRRRVPRRVALRAAHDQEAARAGVGAARGRRPPARRGDGADAAHLSALHRRARAGPRHPRRRLRRGAARHLGRVVARRGRPRGAGAPDPRRRQAARRVADDRLRRLRRRLRPVAGAGRDLRRRLRLRGQARVARSAARSRAPSRSSAWARSTAASRTCPCRRWCSCASWPAATTCSCR